MALEFEIKLSDGVSSAAGSAAHQVDVLTKQMRGLQAAMIKANAIGDERGFSKAASSYQMMGKEVAKLGGALPKTTDAQKRSTSAFSLAATELNSYLELTKKAVDAVRHVGEAIAGTVVEVYKMGAARAQIEATFTALGAGKVAGDKVVSMLDDLSGVLPYTRGEMSAWAKTMMSAGITDLPRLEQATKAAAASSAIMGDQSGKTGDKIAGMVVEFQDAIRMRQGISDLRMELRGTGVTSDEVATSLGVTEKQLQAMAASGRNLSKIGDAIQDSIIKKGIAPMQKMSASWDTISKKLHENIARIFEGIAGTEGFKQFANSMQVLVGVFGQATESGKGMQSEMTGLFDTVLRSAAGVVEDLAIAVIYARIEWLEFRIAIKPVVKAIGEVIDTFKEMFVVKDEITGATESTQFFSDAMLGLKSVLVAIAVVIGGFVFGVILIGATLSALVGIIARFAGEAWAAFAEWVSSAWSIGSDFVSGLWEGIKQGWASMIAKVKGLVDMLPAAVKTALGIHSPSRVMAAIGLSVADGMAVGIDKGSPRVEGATRGLSSVAVSGAAKGAAPSPAKGGLVINVGGIVIGGGGADMMRLTEDAVVSLFERVALTQGMA